MTTGNFGFRFRDAVRVGPPQGSNGDVNFLVASGDAGATYLSSPVIHQSYILCTFSFDYYYASSERSNSDESTAMKLYIEMFDIGRWVLIWESAYEKLANSQYIHFFLLSIAITIIIFNTFLDTWQSISIPIRRVTHPFRIVFHGSQSLNTKTKLHAIDAVSLSKCAPAKASSSPCLAGYFQCANKVCVLTSYQCDFEVMIILFFKLYYIKKLFIQLGRLWRW